MRPMILASWLVLAACEGPAWIAVEQGEEAPVTPTDARITMVSYADWSGPPNAAMMLAWDVARAAPWEGLRDQFHVLHQGLPEGTELRLLFQRWAAEGEPLPVAHLAARTVVGGGQPLGWFSDFSRVPAGGIPILRAGEEGETPGIPVALLCGPTRFWVEAVNDEGAVITRSGEVVIATDAACAETVPMTWD